MAARLGDYGVVTADGSHDMLFSDPAGYTKALLNVVAPQALLNWRGRDMWCGSHSFIARIARTPDGHLRHSKICRAEGR